MVRFMLGGVTRSCSLSDAECLRPVVVEREQHGALAFGDGFVALHGTDAAGESLDREPELLIVAVLCRCQSSLLSIAN